ncbi:hypothetical protein MT997_14155 [Paenibacillus sp. OVF10]|nr:hypothetical protein MT997_14155 [Paenibacillus sp. OVF10]
MTIYTPYITVNGKRIFASAYGLKVFAIEVTEEQNERYWARRAEKEKKAKEKENKPDTKKNNKKDKKDKE